MDIDGNGYANDLLMWSFRIDLNSLTDNGAVWLVKDIDRYTGTNDLENGTGTYAARWIGASTSDQIGNLDGEGYTINIVNLDNNAQANDLIIGTSLADINSVTNSGGLYVIRDAHNKVGSYSLANLDNFDYTWKFNYSNNNELYYI